MTPAPLGAHQATLREDPTGLAPLVARIDEWIAQTRCFPGIERDRASIEAIVKQIRERQASLETPLRILLLGGTGVGKSTLFNALGGADLARAASVRPTTRELTAYFHEANGSGALGPLEAKAKLVAHERPLLRDKIVIDAPDFDSTAQENRALLEQALEVTDLALCVVTAEKYLSSELFELIERYREGIEFVFVLNKLDRAGDGEAIVEDLRGELARHGLGGARVLRVSARAVREAQQAAEARGLSPLDLTPEDGLGAPGAGQWSELRALLERELDRVRIRQIKAAKLADRVRGALARIEERVPDDVPERVDAWRATWRGTLQDLTGDLARSFFGAIHGDYELRNLLRYLFGTGFTGVFGAFMTLIYTVRALLVPGYGRARSFSRRELEQLLEERLAGLRLEAVSARVEQVLDRFEQEGRRLGFRPPPPAEAAAGEPPPAARGAPSRGARFLPALRPERVSELVVAVRSEASRRFYEVCAEAAGEDQTPQPLRQLWNVFPILVVALTVYAFFGSLIPAGIGPSSIARSLEGTIPLLQGGLITLAAVCFLQWPLAERMIERRVQTSLGLLEGVVEQAVEECLGQAALHEPEAVLQEILERHRAFEHLREDAARVLRDETSRRLRRADPGIPELEETAPRPRARVNA